MNVISNLVIDDGVRNRGHRKCIFDKRFNFTGVACGPHLKYKNMCTIEYAGKYEEKTSNCSIF